MKSRLLIGITAAGLMFAACSQSGNEMEKSKEETKTNVSFYVSKDSEYAKPNSVMGYGAAITQDGATDLATFTKDYDKTTKEVKLQGKIGAVCKNKGCWMQMELPEGKSMRVKFKDYAFFVPRDIIGKQAVVQGTISMDTTSVAQLRHYAEDDGKTKAEIEKITEPEFNIVFLANGVLLKDK